MSSFDGTTVDSILATAVAEGVLEGAIMAVADRDGLLHESSAGALPDGMNTVFRMASMTKVIATVATLQLVGEGRLGLDDEVSSVLPEFAELQVLEGFDGDTPRLRPPARQATIRELLTHTSGCSYFFTNADLLRWHELTGWPHILTGSKQSLMAPLVADPGTRWEYGVSTDWAGQVVEAITGQDLDAVVRERIAGPLGMSDTTFAPSDVQRARLMSVKGRAEDGTLADSPIDLPTDPEFYSGGGGIYSTAPDYMRLLRALLRGGELDGTRVLGTDMIDVMFTDQLGGIPLPELMKSVAPELANDVPAMPFKQGWGCGLQLVLEDIPGMRRSGAGSWAGLMNLYYWIDRATGITASFFTQVLPFFDMPIVEKTLAAEGAIYAELGAVVA